MLSHTYIHAYTHSIHTVTYSHIHLHTDIYTHAHILTDTHTHSLTHTSIEQPCHLLPSVILRELKGRDPGK